MTNQHPQRRRGSLDWSKGGPLAEALARYTAKGLSSGQTALAIGRDFGLHPTRNAAIGAAARLGLQWANKPLAPGGGRPRNRPPEGKMAQPKKMMRPAAPRHSKIPTELVLSRATPATSAKAKPSLSLPLVDLSSVQCKWADGAMLERPRFFCGHTTLKGWPYCEGHARRAMP